jgi:Na+:H+ antiporter, NhaA family
MSERQTSASLEIAASLVLLAATALALACANSPIAGVYKSALATPLTLPFAGFGIEDSLKSWIKNALMAVFFLHVGLEIKAEFMEGALSDRRRAMLPFLAAAGGMIAPALVYLACAGHVPGLARGWAIPSATDIAFALGVVGLLGRSVPAPLKALLLAIAVIDDLGAILIIALFYSGGIAAGPVIAAAAGLVVLKALNQARVMALWPYLAVGLVLWVAIYNSGINPTLAGVLLALFVPLAGASGHPSPLHRLEHALKRPVVFAIMPVFAFANAGVSLTGLSFADLAAPATAGIIAGLAFGKPLGIMAAIALAGRLGIASPPPGASFRQLAGIGALAGIGFTMSLFTGYLAFGEGPTMDQVRLGVLTGSLLATILGVALLAGARHTP